MPVLILISHPLSSWEDRAISEVWWIADGAFVGLCFRLLKLDMHYLYATDRGKTGHGLEFQIHLPVF